MQRILQEIMKNIILGTSDAWLMRRSSHRPSDPAYYLEDCRILYDIGTFSQASLKLDLKSSGLETLEWMFQVKILSLLSLIYRDIFSLIKSQAGA